MDDRARALRLWIGACPSVTVSSDTLEDLSDGVAVFEIMNDMSEEFFDLSNIRRNAKDNVKLKERNLKLLTDGIRDYYSDGLFLDYDESDTPDINRIANSSDARELVKLMQLTFGASLKCDKNRDYIKVIQKLDSATQAVLMQVTQEVLQTYPAYDGAYGASPPGAGVDNSAIGEVGQNDFGAHARELEAVAAALRLENKDMRDELTRAKASLEEAQQRVQQLSNYDDPKTPAGKQQQMLRDELKRTKEELYNLESAKFVAEERCQQLEAEVYTLKSHVAQIEEAAANANQYRDEADELRHRADKAAHLEKMVASMKQSLNEVTDLRAQVRELEEQNRRLNTEKVDLEDEMRALRNSRMSASAGLSGDAALATALAEKQQELTDAHERAVVSERELQNQIEKNRELQERLDEFELGTVHVSGSSNSLSTMLTTSAGTDTKEADRLKQELAAAKKRAEQAEALLAQQKPAVKASTVTTDDAGLAEKYNAAQQELTALNEKLAKMQLEAKKTVSAHGDQLQQLNDVLMEKNELVTRNNLMANQIAKLSEDLAQKYGMDGPDALQKVLSLENKVSELSHELDRQRESYEKRLMRADDEQRLIATAWYELGTRLERKTLQDRVNQAAGLGASFLNRQRDYVQGKPPLGLGQ